VIGVACATHSMHNSVQNAVGMIPFAIRALVVKMYVFLYIVHVTQLKDFVIFWAWSVRGFCNIAVLDFFHFC
jgi:hypothetical protein